MTSDVAGISTSSAYRAKFNHAILLNFFVSSGFSGLLFVACLVYYLIAFGVAWHESLLVQHGFRQTQTAINTYFILKGGPWLDYETPVLGPPWSLPFEFPLYQWIVALLVHVTGLPLDQAGRLVGGFFFLLTLIPASSLLASIGLGRRLRLLVLSLLLVSPFYIFWSRAFLIEQLALFLSVSYVAVVVRFLRFPHAGTALLAVLVGALAAAVKITTFAPWFLAASLYVLRDLRHRATQGEIRNASVHRATLLALMAVLPLSAGMGWTRFADHQRQRNPLGRNLTSSALKDWTLGTSEQRFSLQVWKQILDRYRTVLGGEQVMLSVTLGVILARRRRAEYIACLLLYLSAPLIFINLYYVHSYYYFANNPFLVAAVGIALAAMVERGGLLRGAAILELIFIMVISVLAYLGNSRTGPNHPERPELIRLAELVQRHTSPEDVIVLHGFDWSPEVPYYSRRRALMLPDWGNREDFERALLNMRNYKIGTLIINKSSSNNIINSHEIKRVLTHYGFEGHPYSFEPPFELYFAPAHSQTETAASARPERGSPP
jgi:hypothetical protein